MDAVMAEDAQKAAKLESLRVNAASWREKMKENGMSIGEHKTECCEPGGAMRARIVFHWRRAAPQRAMHPRRFQRGTHCAF